LKVPVSHGDSGQIDLPGQVRRPALVRVPAVLFDDSVKQLPSLPYTDCLNGNSGNGSEQFCNFLRVSDFGVVVFYVGVDQSKHKNAPPKVANGASVTRFLLQNK
jgi:hypothetical protein